MNPAWDKVIKESSLISLPEIYLKLQQKLYSEDFALQEIVDIISLDPAITARLLHMVNSSYFGLASRIETVSHAVNYLGVQQVHDLVLTTSIASTFSEIHSPAFNLNQFWKQSVFIAITARELATVCNVIDSERLFVAGLLSNIGELLLHQSIPDLMQQAVSLAEQNDISLIQAEKEVLGFDHVAIGAELLVHWHLPESLTESIKHQLNPIQAEIFPLESAILNTAVLSSATFEQGDTIETLFSRLDPAVLDLTQITQENLEKIVLVAKQNLNSVVKMIFPYINKNDSA